MEAVRNRRLYSDAEPPLWERLEEFRCVIGQKPQFFIWENVLAGILGTDQTLDRRGIVLGSEDMMCKYVKYVLTGVRRILGLGPTQGWKGINGSPDFVQTIMKSFYEPDRRRITWIMVETCRDRIRNRHAGLTEAVRGDDGIVYKGPASLLQTPRAQLFLDSGIAIPANNLRFALSNDRDQTGARLVKTDIKRTLWTPSRAEPFGAVIACYCLANPVEDGCDLARGFVPAGLRCLRPSGINAANLITWFRLDTISRRLENYTIDIDPESGELLSLRHQKATLQFAIEIDPWLDYWLRTALRSFS